MVLNFKSLNFSEWEHGKKISFQAVQLGIEEARGTEVNFLRPE